MKTKLVIAALLAATAMPAAAVVADFDTFSGAGVVPDGYAGIIWGTNWNYYDSSQPPYYPVSPAERIYRNYTIYGFGAASVPFDFSAPVTFTGAAISGYTSNPVTFDLYLGGSLVFTSAAFTPTDTPTFYNAGYSGKVDEVRFTSGPNIVFDDITYTASVPEPASWALMIAGFGLVGGALRRRATTVAA